MIGYPQQFWSEDFLAIKRAQDQVARHLPSFAHLRHQAPALADAVFRWPGSGVAMLRPNPPDLLERRPAEILAEFLRRVDDQGLDLPFGVPRFARHVTDAMFVWARNRTVLADPAVTLTGQGALQLCAALGFGTDGIGFNPGKLSRLEAHGAWWVFQTWARKNVFLGQAILDDPGAAAPPNQDADPVGWWEQRIPDLMGLNDYLQRLAPADRRAELSLPFPVLLGRAARAALAEGTIFYYRAPPRRSIATRGRHRPDRPLPRLAAPQIDPARRPKRLEDLPPDARIERIVPLPMSPGEVPDTPQAGPALD